MKSPTIGRTITVALVMLVVLGSAGTAAALSVDASGGSVSPGETVTVEITAKDVGTLSLDDIPGDWTIESYEKAGATALADDADDGTQTIAWIWSDDKDSVTLEVTLSVPDDASEGDHTMSVESGNADDESATDSLIVTVESDSGGLLPGIGSNGDETTTTASNEETTADSDDEPTTESVQETTAESDDESTTSESDDESTTSESDDPTRDDSDDATRDDSDDESGASEPNDESTTDDGGGLPAATTAPGFRVGLVALVIFAVVAVMIRRR